MKRIFLPYIFALTACVGATAAPVTRNAALVSAKNFLSARGIDSALTPLPDPDPSRSADPDADRPYYIFNIGDDEGFVIMSGDDRAKTVLAYSNSRSMDLNTMPESCKAWLGQYEAEITSMPAGPQAAVPVRSVPALTPAKTEPIPPMLSTKWDQGDPYNRDCPIDPETGLRCVTGCVATATAQIMNYYRYPEKGVGSVTYNDKGVERSIDFADYPAFDWSAMLDTYTKDASEAEAAPVASLMKAVGYASKMLYTSTVSNAAHLDAGYALVNNFGYDKNIHNYERARMTDDEWYAIILNELKAARPIIYSGFNSEGGHSFVCDGYDGEGYFHINWGWNGLSDGYFSLSALTPPSQSTGGTASGYTLSQWALCHITPPGVEDSKPQADGLLSLYNLYFRGSDDFHIAASTPVLTTDIENAQLFIYTFNRGVENFSGEICVAELTDGTVNPLMTETITDIAVNGYTGVRFPIASIPALNDGKTHTVSFYYRTSNTDSWHAIRPSTISEPHECTVTVNGSEVIFKSIYPDINVKLVSAPAFGPLYTGIKTTWDFSITNTGDTRFEGYAGIALIDASGDYKGFFQTPVICPLGETVQVEVQNSLSTITSGEYKAVPYRTSAANPTPETIIALAEPVDVNIYSIVLFPAGGNSYLLMNDNSTVLSLTIYNMGGIPWHSALEGEIIMPDGSIAPGKVFTGELTVEPGANITTNLETEGLNLTRGNYTINFRTTPDSSNYSVQLPLIVMADISALDAIAADKAEITVGPGRINISSPVAVSAIRLIDTAGRQLVSESAGTQEFTLPTDHIANGIYILSVEFADGTMTNRKVIIRN